ncbi:response regulator transcription factor [Pleomorphomonas sp. PLEO]|uniref:helix-turn-helix transcriptional regulator n=1 Tax=Pleomorphomonas sp. PLEO TaxID=3239306 RepID=UPI00351DE7EF
MQAKKHEWDQDPPRAAQDASSRKARFVSRANALTAHRPYDAASRDMARHKWHIDLSSAKISHMPSAADELSPALAPHGISYESVRPKPPNQTDFIDQIFFRKEIHFFILERVLLSITKRKEMISDIDLHLNEREIETVSYLAAGYGAKEIARELNLSPRTVEHRIEALKRRVGARNVTHLIAMILLSNSIRDSGESDIKDE